MNREEYGTNYQAHLLEEYKLYVEMADRVSQRRGLANAFFLSLHTGLFTLAVGLAGFSSDRSEFEISGLIAALFGLPLAILWIRIINSYRQLNAAKYTVVRELEKHLPAAPYDRESTLGEGGEDSNKYHQLTKEEVWVPGLFFVAYAAVATTAGILLWRN